MARDGKGRFIGASGEQYGTHLSSKGYPRVSAGPCRNKYVHKLVMEGVLGRELLPHEDVDHRDENKQNPKWWNLELIDHTAHGYKSAAQGQFMKRKEEAERKEWLEYGYIEEEYSGEGTA